MHSAALLEMALYMLLLVRRWPRSVGSDQFMINACIKRCECWSYVLRASAVERRLTLLQPAFVQVEQQDEEPKSGGRVLAILPVGPQVEAGPPVVLAMY